MLAKAHAKLVKRLRIIVYLVKLNLTKLHLKENVNVMKNIGKMEKTTVRTAILVAKHATQLELNNVHLVIKVKIENKMQSQVNVCA